MYKCEICNLGYEKFQDKANHVRWVHIGINEEKRKRISEGAKIGNELRFGKKIKINWKCSNKNCNNEFEIEYRENSLKEKYYCSRSCANSRGKMTEKTKKIISDKIKNRWKEGLFDDLSFLVDNQKFSSKTERMIVNHFKKNFTKDLWKSGGGLKYKGVRISRDLYSDFLKVCFEYDGIWHFKDIKGQLERKKLVDSLLEDWCIENGYRLIRVQEEFYEDLVQIEKLIYDKKDSVLKIGDKY